MQVDWDMIGLVILPILGHLHLKSNAVQKDLEHHKINVAENYVKKDELKAALDKIDANFQRVFEKLDNIKSKG